MNSNSVSDEENDDEYTKLLIKKEFNTLSKELMINMRAQSSNIDVQDAKSDTNMDQNQQNAVHSLDLKHDINELKIDQDEMKNDIRKLRKNVKIIKQLYEQIPKRRPEEDPNYGQYKNAKDRVSFKFKRPVNLSKDQTDHDDSFNEQTTHLNENSHEFSL